MSRKPLTPSPLPLAVAALLTCGFVGCMSETRSLNTLDAGNGGEEGETPDAGTGGRGVAGQAPAGRSGLYPNETGGGPTMGGSGGSLAGSFAVDPNAGGRPQGGAGSPNGGVPNAGSGALAGFAGNAGNAGNAGGSVAGGAGAPPCDTSIGTGCDGGRFCVDDPLDSCAADFEEHCPGSCAVPELAPTCSGISGVECPQDFECLPEPNSLLGTDPYGLCIGGQAPDCLESGDCAEGFSCVPVGDARRCVPNRAHCSTYGICNSVQAPKCPIGYAVSDAQGCDYLCVPYEQCGCEKDSDCVAPSLCDRVNGRCFAPRAAAPRCLEPYDPGPCDANFSVYAFVDGECQVVQYGGCEGNDNRFATHAECLSACEGAPLEHDCPAGSVEASGCLACGAGGGCTQLGNYCFAKCESTDDCDEAGFSCVEGICQVVGCT